ncbi:chorion protein S19 [Eurosta solidaginis]|uniref:chorion protein S19 n=1 Tax=Eurosta solidaginis TaxID=178769 RepID=UPI0035316E45
MKSFVYLSLALFATVVMAHPYGHHSAPQHYGESSHKVHEVSLDGLSKIVDIAAIEKYLNAPAHHHHDIHSASYAPAKYVAAASEPVPGAVISKSYSAAPSAYHGHHGYSGEGHGAVYNAAPVYDAAAASSYSPKAEKYAGAYKSAGYGTHSVHKYTELPAYVTQIHAGKHNYKTFETPIKYSTVTLPVAPAGPVANLYVPEHHSSYSGPSY